MKVPVEGRPFQLALVDDLATLAEDLAVALALAGDLPFRAWIRRQAGADDGAPLFARVRASVWAELDGAETRLHRGPPETGLRLDLLGRIQSDPTANGELNAARRRLGARARADGMLQGLFDRATDPTRRRMANLLDWSPLLEHASYRFGARCMPVLQGLRRAILPAADTAAFTTRTTLLAYWRLVLGNAHLGLLAATPGARPWLVDMAKTFSWVDWTPTLSFVQERSLWFGAVAARHAAAFGQGVVEPYLQAMAIATHPLRVFDAAFALVAIGLNEPHLAPALVTELTSQASRLTRQVGPHSQMQIQVIETALLCLRDPEAADRAFRTVAQPLDVGLEGGGGLLGRPAIQMDMTVPVQGVGYLGLLALPRLINLTALDLYQVRSPRLAVSAFGPSEIAAHIARAWAAGPARTPRLH